MFRDDGNLMIGCDAYETGCSTILQQEQDGHFENCAFVFGLKHVRPYLQGDKNWQNSDKFLNLFTVRIRIAFAIVLPLKIPPHLKYVDTIPVS